GWVHVPLGVVVDVRGDYLGEVVGWRAVVGSGLVAAAVVGRWHRDTRAMHVLGGSSARVVAWAVMLVDFLVPWPPVFSLDCCSPCFVWCVASLLDGVGVGIPGFLGEVALAHGVVD